MKTPFVFLATLLVAVCSHAATPGEITTQPFGKTADGTPVEIFTLRNGKGMEARITNYGGIMVSLTVPDRDGKMSDVVLGFDNFDQYLNGNPYFGVILGRFANRIGGGKFELDGQVYKLPINSGTSNTLHGGMRGFDKVLWTPKIITTEAGPALQLTYVSKDGEEGFPGNLTCTCTYSLTSKNELRIDYSATTDKPTVVNLSHHSYFNLAGQGEGDILGHVVMINASKFTPIGATRVPTGELRNVEGTPLDFRKPTAIGDRINSDYEQLTLAKGYDHNWVIDKKPGELALAAKVVEPKSGRVMEVLTTEPGLQMYTGNSMHDSEGNKAGKAYHFRYAVCFEPGHFPDSPNRPEFPSTVLRPGETFRSTIIYRFSTEKSHNH